MGSLGVDSNKLTTQQTICKSGLGPTSSSPITIEPRECSNNIVEPLCSTDIHERVGESPLVTPMSPRRPTQVVGGLVRTQKDWVQAENGRKSFSVPPEEELIDGICPDNPAVDGLLVATSSDGPAAALVEFISAEFYSNGTAVALLELNGSSSNEASFNKVTVVLSKIDLANLQLLKGRFFAETGFMDFGVNNVDKAGSVSSEFLFQGADNEGTRQTVVGGSD
nr:hypothetical protein CFP56_53802 [Quercus suber]